MPPKSQIPTTLCNAGIRVVAPYWITVNLSIKGEKDDTYGKVLARMHQQECMKANRWRNCIKPSIGWWIGELEAGRVAQIGNGNHVTAISGDNVLSTASKVKLQAQYHYHEQSIMYNLKDLSDLILYQDQQYLVVNKPAGVDVLENPAAGRVHNSLPGLLKELFARDPSTANTKIMPAHRLDGPVSGVVCCGITNKDTKRLQRRIQLGQTSKTYVARVKIPSSGLPTLPMTIETQMGFDNNVSLAYVVETKVAAKDSTTDKDGSKFSKTVVQECLGTIGKDNTAIVTIRLYTGRKHQIRCHLQHAGLPIANDHRYGGVASASPLSAFGMPDPPLELMEMLQNAWKESHSNCTFCEFEQDLLKKPSNNQSDQKKTGPSVNTGIWLHSWKYAFPTLGKEFEAPLPTWAQTEEPRPEI